MSREETEAEIKICRWEQPFSIYLALRILEGFIVYTYVYVGKRLNLNLSDFFKGHQLKKKALKIQKKSPPGNPL